MKHNINKYLFVILAFMIFSCNKKENENKLDEDMLKGETTFLVDETLKPIVEDLVQVFESRYNAKITINSKSETEVIQALVKDSSQIAVMARKLSVQELKIFENKKIRPRITPFAKDAIALIRNKSNNDTLISLKDIISFMHGEKQSQFKGLVFDNPNSSTVRYFLEKAGLKNLPEQNVFSFKSNEEVIQYVAKNEGMLGIVGVDFIFEPMPLMQQYLDRINVLSVKDVNSYDYFSPTQNNIAEGKYPLARELYIINCQGFKGLGMGFASFTISDVGQRIILKSGLMPLNVPPRKILVRNKINNEKE